MTRARLTKEGLRDQWNPFRRPPSERVRSEDLVEGKTIRERLDPLLTGRLATILVATILARPCPLLARATSVQPLAG